MVQPKQIPESWAGFSPPMMYVMKTLRKGPRRIVHVRSLTYINRSGTICTSWNIVASLQIRKFIRQKKDGRWELNT